MHGEDGGTSATVADVQSVSGPDAVRSQDQPICSVSLTAQHVLTGGT